MKLITNKDGCIYVIYLKFNRNYDTIFSQRDPKGCE